MNLVCTKFNEPIPHDEQVHCHHPSDYCRYRSSCMIHFLDKEQRLEGTKPFLADELKPQDGASHDDAQV